MSLRFKGKLFTWGLVCTSAFSTITMLYAEEEGNVAQVNSALTALFDAEIVATTESTPVNMEPESQTSDVAVSETTQSETILETQSEAKPETEVSTHGLELARSTIVFRPIDGEAPLAAPLRWAHEVARNIESDVADYTCTVTKRERINGVLGKEEVMSAKVRHEPFSVYLRFNQPRRIDGREVIYVENANNGELQAHGVGFEALAGTLSLKPNGRLAMKNNRHPITEIGVLNLVRQLQCVGQANIENSCISVRYFDAQINDRDCVCIEVVNNNRKLDPMFCKGHIYVDMELNMPVKFISWGWGNGRDFPLMEEYTYSDIQLNPGLTDKDFDIRNPEYGYRESR